MPRNAAPDTGQTPFGISLATGAATVTVAAMIAAALFPPADAAGRLVVVALAVAGHTAITGDLRTCLPVTGLGYLLFNGFLANRYGILTWDTTSRTQAAAFLGAAALGAAAAYLRRVRAAAALDTELHQLVDPTPPGDSELHRRD